MAGTAFMSPTLGQDDKGRFTTVPQPATPIANHGAGYAYQHGNVHGFGTTLETPQGIRYQTGPVVSQHGSPFYPGQHHPVFAAQQDAANLAAYYHYMLPGQAPPALTVGHYGSPPATPQTAGSFAHQQHHEYQTYTPPYIHHQGFTHLTPPSTVPHLEYRRGSNASFISTGSPPTPQHTDASPHARIVHGIKSFSLNSSPEHHHGAQDLFGAKKAYTTMNSPQAPSIYPPSLGDDRQDYPHPDGGEQINTNVYIRGLPAEIDDDKLYDMTAIYGPIVSHKAIIDTENGGCKGYGFARFTNVEDAARCIEGLTAQNIEADFARESFNSRLKRLADPCSTNVYVSNLPKDMNEKGMEDIFAGYRVVSNRILRDANNKSRGVGFARFPDRQTCDKIIAEFHGRPIGNTGNILQIRYADTAAQKKFKATTARKKSIETMLLYSKEAQEWVERQEANKAGIPEDRDGKWRRGMNPSGLDVVQEVETPEATPVTVVKAEPSLSGSEE